MHRRAVGGDPGACLPPGAVGKLGFVDRRIAPGPAGGRTVVLKQHRRGAPAQMPFQVVGQHAQEHLGAAPFGLVDVDRAHLELAQFQGSECPFHPCQALVGIHRPFGAETGRRVALAGSHPLGGKPWPCMTESPN